MRKRDKKTLGIMIICNLMSPPCLDNASPKDRTKYLFLGGKVMGRALAEV